MPIEKVFAISADRETIWRALTGELEVADDAAYHVERAVANELLAVSVQLHGGVEATITYQLVTRDDHTEVVATMAPRGLRYVIYRIITLGRGDTNYEVLLVQALSNLKAAVEGNDAGA